MPPIRKVDGTPVTPKGISQIRTGDGRILFDGPAIPDYGVSHHPLIERSNVTLVDQVGDNDGEAVGTTNVSNNYFEGFAEDGDGSDDYVRFPSEILSNITEFTIYFTIDEFTGTSTKRFGIRDTSIGPDPFTIIEFNRNQSGDVRGNFRD